MKERLVEIKTPDGTMEAFVSHPEQDGPFSAVFVLSDIFGLREELHEVARKFSVAGYYAIVPDLHYRHGKIRLPIPENSRAWSMADLGTDNEKIARDAGSKLKDAQAMEDLGAALKFFDGEPVKKGPKGAVGYCMGGRLVLVAAGSHPDHFRAVAGLHPSVIVHDGPLSVEKLAAKMQGEVYCGFPEADPLAPTSTIATFAKAMEKSPAKYHYERHKGAVHGYALPYRNCHHTQAALRDYELILAMFRRQLG